jgi:hypothetical protein
MTAADISRFTQPGELSETIAMILAVLCAGPKGDKPAFKDANELVDILAFTAALIVEQSPEFTTPRHLRLGSEEFGRRTHEFVKTVREQRDRTGTPVMSAFAESHSVIPMPAEGHA